MYTIRKARKEEAGLIQDLGTKVYFSTYTAILSREQIDFMLERNYTPEAIQASMESGQDFYLLARQDTEPIGFVAIQKKSTQILRIEKLYLLASCQGLGLGKMLIEFAQDKAKAMGCATLELNVNRGNPAYHFYLRQGFQVIDEVDIPYYGYVLDDYVMQMQILR